MPERLLTSRQVAELLQVSNSTLRRWRRQHYGPTGIIVGSRIRYSAEDVDAFLAQQTALAAEKAAGY